MCHGVSESDTIERLYNKTDPFNPLMKKTEDGSFYGSIQKTPTVKT